MPPSVMNRSNKENNGGTTELARRRRADSKDLKLSPAATLDDRHSTYILNQQQHSSSPTRSGIRARRKLKSSFSPRFRSVCVLALDLLIAGYMIRSIVVFLRPTVDAENDSPALSDSVLLSRPAFAKSLPDMPPCEELQPDDITFTLAVQLSGNRLWMMKHHCELWGATAPISVAMWTSLGAEEILVKLKSMGCDLNFLHLQVVSSENHSGVDYPINQLRNMALKAVNTSHVLLLDVDFWESVDLFDTLNSPTVRKALSSDPRLAVVIPAFEIHDLQCGASLECRARHLFSIPADFEDLVISLGNNKSLPYDPINFSRQGSTNYRRWMRESQGELLDLPCVSSDQYQPYMVLRACEGLPPFQESFSGYGRNNMAWMVHLRRVGYRLQQIGGSFITHFPHVSSSSKLEWEKLPKANEESSKQAIVKYLRGRTDKTFWEFKRWLDVNVDDAARTEKCDDYVDDEDSLWSEGS